MTLSFLYVLFIAGRLSIRKSDISGSGGEGDDDDEDSYDEGSEVQLE